ncbi:hypothetical protein W02_02660 [Nitrospira sp. KM1]|uniref:c-type cytochrome n=1 Tax=Nitrospira sp. KM1 TaxID=1936990 RepID=UPI0013A71D9A|nr:cytochrome c [Nitrospira sp. KM1]BCA53126.1 hypothetical protein W02_02660 [Nitrospira sp. KM1]
MEHDRSPKSGKRLLVGLGIVAVVCYLLNDLVLDGHPVTYDDRAMHFKYGSIGSDNLSRGFPYRIWQVLPEMFPEHLPCGKPKSYEAFGLTRDPNSSVDRPIGLSKRWRLGIGYTVGINCAFCHVSTVRPTPDSYPRIILGMPANKVNAESFFRFLFAVVEDPKFTADNVLRHIQKKGQLGYWQTFIHRYVLIPAFRDGGKRMKHEFGFLDRRPTPFGPGRVDTWAYYKVHKLQDSFWLFEKLPRFGRYTIEMDPGSLAGLADFPALWREKTDNGFLHWDGNNQSVQERNITAALGAGATPATLDLPAVTRISQWFESPDYQVETYHEIAPNPKPDPVLFKTLASQGANIFDKNCKHCHAAYWVHTSGLVGIDEIGTDRARLETFSEALRDKLNEVRHLSMWKLENYRKTYGYANLLLTGIWLRAPYLHNGSVPTLWHLLQKPEWRPKRFCRGNDLYDWENVGFAWELTDEQCPGFFKYDTALQGNGNGGHTYGTELPDQEKRALIEYLKTL